MVILDTNVVAEMMKATPSPEVAAWLNNRETSTLYLTSITIAEINYGLWIMPQGKRRRLLEEGFERILVEAFAGRILTFDEKAAHAYGELMGQRRQMGRPLGVLDGQIAAIARVKACAVATRNVPHFAGCGIEVLDPFAPV